MKRFWLLVAMAAVSCAAASAGPKSHAPSAVASTEPLAGSLPSSQASSEPLPQSSASSAPSSNVPPGPLTKDSIRTVIRSWAPEIKGCYERQFIRNSRLKGQVIARFMIGEDGKVASVDMSSSTIKAPQVVDCVGKLFSLMEFPKPESGMVLITYPIDFDWEVTVK